MHKLTIILIALLFFVFASSCRNRRGDAITVALPEKFTTLDALTTPGTEAATERVKTLMFNSLVKKDTNFDYVGELAKDIVPSPDGTKITFAIRDGVKFHNGKDLTSADAKYTLDYLLSSTGAKAGSFFETGPNKEKLQHMTSIETPDPKTLVITLARPSLRNTLLSNLVAVPIIPEGSGPQQKENPVGTGPFRFESVDSGLSVLELSANKDYWDGPPKFERLRLKVLTEASSLQAELQSGGVDIAPNPSNLQADMIEQLGKSPNLKTDKFDGSNIQYLIFNIKEGPLANAKVRQAIAYAVDRNRIISELFLNEARPADSVLPPESWAFAPGKHYDHDPAKAKQLLQESGYKGEPIVFKYRAGGAATNQYSQVIQSSLNDLGMNIQIETLDGPTLLKQLAQGQFEMYTGIWVGGNTDPFFMRDLFSTEKIPSESVPCCNRGRYSNHDVDAALNDAVNATDKKQAKQLFGKAWDLVSDDVPFLPLWHPANVVVSNKRISGIRMWGSGDWVFLKDVTAQ